MRNFTARILPLILLIAFLVGAYSLDTIDQLVRTSAAVDVPAAKLPSKREELVAFLESQLGVEDRETIQRYLAATGLSGDHHWCAAAMKYAHNAVDVETPGANAWSPTWFPNARRIQPPVLPGDTFGTYSLAKKRIDHVGAIVGETDTHYITIEGNVRAGFARPGVRKLRRSKSDINHFSRWIE